MLFREINNKYSVKKIRTGYPTTEVLGDELDSASVFLTDIDEINIEPYDVVELIDLNENKNYHLVATYVKEYATLQKPYKYNYQVNLMSLTKKLETIVLPNLSITNIGQNRTVGFYIRKASYYFKEPVEFEIPSILENMICPEIQLGSSTLREYLDFLYSLNGCIVKLKYDGVKYIITYQDLNERKGEMPREYIATLTSSASAENYASSLETELDEYISQEPTTEIQQLKSDDYVFDSNNARLILTHRIYDLLKVVVKDVKFDSAPYIAGYEEGYGVGERKAFLPLGKLSNFLGKDIATADLDITNYITIKDIYETLEILESGKYDPKNPNMYSKNYKNNTLYWERGSSNLENFNFYQTGNLEWLLGQDDTAFINILKSAIRLHYLEILSQYNFYGDYMNYGPYYWVLVPGAGDEYIEEELIELGDTTWKNAVFETTYIPYSAVRMSIEKNKATYDVEMFNNQTEALVNVELFARQSVEKIKQLGNDALEFSARNQGTEIKYQLGMTFDDYILAKLEIVHYLDQTYYKGILYKNFSNRNIQTILNRQKRYTALQDENESIVRHEIIKKKVYIDFSDSATSENVYLNKKAKYCEFNIENPDISGVIIPTLTRAGNALVYTAEFLNQSSYGTKRSSVIKDTKYETLEYLKYVDGYGEAENITLTFYDNALKNDENYAKDFPLLTENTKGNIELFKVNYPILKDNREHLKLSYEIIFKSDRFVIGNEFLSFLTNAGSFRQFNVAVVENEITNDIDTTKLTSIRKYVFGNIFNLPVGKNYVIYNENGLLLGINNFTEENKYIVLIEK